MKTCDICSEKLGFVKFRYDGGCICKKCYETASRNCTETIRTLSLSEISGRCCLHNQVSETLTDFEVTNRIGNYILIDEKNKRFCVPHNRLYSKEYRRPQVLSLSDVSFYKITCDPNLSLQDLQSAGINKAGRVASLSIDIFLHSMTKPLSIHILSTPVRVKSYAFRRSYAFVERIISYLETNGVICKSA